MKRFGKIGKLKRIAALAMAGCVTITTAVAPAADEILLFETEAWDVGAETETWDAETAIGAVETEGKETPVPETEEPAVGENSPDGLIEDPSAEEARAESASAEGAAWTVDGSSASVALTAWAENGFAQGTRLAIEPASAEEVAAAEALAGGSAAFGFRVLVVGSDGEEGEERFEVELDGSAAEMAAEPGVAVWNGNEILDGDALVGSGASFMADGPGTVVFVRAAEEEADDAEAETDASPKEERETSAPEAEATPAETPEENAETGVETETAGIGPETEDLAEIATEAMEGTEAKIGTGSETEAARETEADAKAPEKTEAWTEPAEEPDPEGAIEASGAETRRLAAGNLPETYLNAFTTELIYGADADPYPAWESSNRKASHSGCRPRY